MIVQSMRYNTLPKDVGATTRKKIVRHGDQAALKIRTVVRQIHADRTQRLHAEADAILAGREMSR